MWEPQADLTILGSLGGTTTAPTALNNLGEVVGYSTTAQEETFAFAWDGGAGTRSLGSLDGSFSQASGINDLGQMCGFALDGQWAQHAVIWEPDGSARVLDGAAGWVEAVAINDAGVAAGMMDLRPVRWDADGSPHELGHVIQQGWVQAINAHGAVCGSSDLPGEQAYQEAVVWEPDGTLRPLGVLNASGSLARDINDAGEVVGWAGLILYGPKVAVHWAADGTMTDLNVFARPGWTLEEAVAINARGDITGVCVDPLGFRQAFVLWKESPASAGGIAPDSVRRLRIYPNPWDPERPLTIEPGGLPPGPAVARLFEPGGREIARAPFTISPAGTATRLRFDQGFPRRERTAGAFFLRVESAGGGAATARLVPLPPRP